MRRSTTVLMYFNFTSGTSAGSSIASDINPWLANDFSGWGPGRYGIVALDWEGTGLTQPLVNMNFGPLPSGGSYAFYNENSGKCLDDTGNSTSDGTIMQQWDDAGHSNQR